MADKTTSIAPAEYNWNVCPPNISSVCFLRAVHWFLSSEACLLLTTNLDFGMWAALLITMSRADRPTHSNHLRRFKCSFLPTDNALDCPTIPSQKHEHFHPHQNDASDEDSGALSSQLLFTQPQFVSAQPPTTLPPLQPKNGVKHG
jgi:hypothetical protein